MPVWPQHSTSPTATKEYVRYLPTRLSRKISSASGSTSRMSAATSAKPINSSVRASVRIPDMFSPSDLEDEQSLGTEHEQPDNHEQRKDLGHRAGEEEFERRLRLRDRECG